MPRSVELEPQGPATTLKVKGGPKVKPPKPPRPKKKDLVPDTFLMEGFFPANTETSVRYTTDFPVDNEVTVLHTNLTDMTPEQAAADILADLDAGTYVSATANGIEVTLAPENGAAVVTVVDVFVTNPPDPEPPGTPGGVIGGDPAIIQLTGVWDAGAIIEMDYVTDAGGTTTAEYTIVDNATGLQLAAPYAAFLDTMPDLIVQDVGDLLYIYPETPATTVTLLAFRVIPAPGSGGGDGGETGASYAVTLSEALQGAAAIESATQKLAMILEAMTIDATLQETLTILADVSDELFAGDSTQMTASLLAELFENVNVYSLLKTTSDMAQGWVMNTEGAMPVSEYDNFEFNSLTTYDGVMYGTTDDGLYEMGADNDAGTGITAEMSSLMLDMGTSRMKRIRSAYLGYTSGGDLVLKVRSVSDGQLSEHWYKAREATAEAPREGYVQVGQGLKSRYWQFELTNVDGADFEIDQLELHPLFLGRRV